MGDVAAVAGCAEHIRHELGVSAHVPGEIDEAHGSTGVDQCQHQLCAKQPAADAISPGARLPSRADAERRVPPAVAHAGHGA
jgi:hypothetical protein